MTLFQRVCGWLLGEPSLKQQQIDREIDQCLKELAARDLARREQAQRDGLEAIMHSAARTQVRK